MLFNSVTLPIEYDTEEFLFYTVNINTILLKHT